MADITKRQSDGSQWPSGFNFYGSTQISGSAVQGFVNKRGDVVSGSHVVGSNLRMGNSVNGNTGGCGTWQVAAGTYQDIFPSVWPTGAFKVAMHVMVVNSGSFAGGGIAAPSVGTWGGYRILEEGQFLTGSSPFKGAAGAQGPALPTSASLAQWCIVSGALPTRVDPPFDFSVYTLIFADNSNGGY